MTSLLVFRAGTAQPKAVPLGLVTRLEEIAVDKIELSNGRYMVQYREQLMPLVQMEGVSVQSSGAQPILVFADDGRSMGLVVDEIIDIVEERLNIEVGGSQDGILGSAVIKGQATEVIDVGHFLPMAFADWFSRKEMRPSSTPSPCCWSTIQPSSATCWPRAQGRRLQGPNRAERPGGPRGAALGTILRRGFDRHRDARHERFEFAETSAPTTIWSACRSSRCRRWSRRRRSSAAGRPASTTMSPSSTAPV